MPDCILTPPIDEFVITYTQLSGVHGVDTQSHVLPTIQSQFSDINLSFVSQQATASQVIDDMMRQLSFDKTELDGDAGFADVAGSGVDSSGLSHDDSFGVDDLDLNLNEPVNLNVSQVETQSELHVSEELDVGPAQEPILTVISTQEPIVAEVSTQEPIVAEVSTEALIVEEVGTQKFSVEDVVIEDYVNSGEDGEDAEQGNGQEDESARTDGEFFYDDEGIDTAYETEYDVQSSEDAGTDDDDDVDEDFLVDEENEIVEPDVDVHLFGISMDLPFDNIGITNLVSDDVLEGEDVDVINANGFNSDPGNDEERNYRKRRLSKLRTEMEGVINASGQWKYSFYTGQKFNTPKKAKDRVYLHSIKSRRNLKLYKNDSVRIRASACIYNVTRANPDIPVKAVQDQLQRELEVQISMSKAFRAKAKAEREIRGDHIERNTDPSLPTRVFQRIYVCLGALKLGFRACRRDLLGLDGAFMKGPFPGQVLVAVGLDSNNGIYPLAYALVEAKMRPKGIILAIKTIYPSAEHRYCLRHIHENIKQGWCGQAYKDLLWRAASAINVKDFEKCRAKSDLLLNNICEVFNGKIVGGRDKSVITLLEYIREIIESIKKEAHLIKVQWNGANKYQVSGSLGDQYVVDVVSMTCSCRKWKLTGIPCKYDVADCWNMALLDRAAPPPETWVGRPKKKKKRSKHEDEPLVNDGKLSRKGRTITCQSCENIGHNKATCKGQGRKATTGGNNAEGSGSASRQAQQTEHAVGQDGSGGSGAGVVLGLSATAGEGGAGDPCGAGVTSQDSSILVKVKVLQVLPDKVLPVLKCQRVYVCNSSSHKWQTSKSTSVATV
ncbi:heat stress transcription factor B-4-like protein [Tanacetum coccineum]|uniref:Heat stress transcription factor B-4-like protein n=1 Tax=Tanacetum coccineum TaxID=301880 RepID=A0ABQ5I5L6_9ASTR